MHDVRDVVEELGERLRCLVADVEELVGELLGALLLDQLGLEHRLVGEEISIVRARQVQLEIYMTVGERGTDRQTERQATRQASLSQRAHVEVDGDIEREGARPSRASHCTRLL